MAGKRPRVKFEIDHDVAGKPKYADYFEGKQGRNDSVKIVLVDNEGEFEAFLTIRVAEFLSGAGIIEEMEGRNGAYLKVLDQDTELVFKKTRTEDGSVITVYHGGVELKKRLAVRGGTSTEAAAPRGGAGNTTRGGKAPAQSNVQKLSRIHHNYGKAFEFAQHAMGLYGDTGSRMDSVEKLDFQSLVATFFIEFGKAGVNCTPEEKTDTEATTEKQSERREPQSRRGAPNSEPTKESYEDKPEALNVDGNDDLPF